MAKKSSSSYIFNLFPKDFLRPYGIATERVDTDMLERRLQTFTCELMRRPGVGISQFAQTFEDNYERVKVLSTWMTQPKIETYLSDILTLVNASKNLNLKKGITTKKNIRKDVKKLFKTVTTMKSKNVDSFMHMGASFYLMGLHLAVLKYALKHPLVIKKKVKGKGTFTKNFKKWAEKRESKESACKSYLEVCVSEIESSVKKTVCLFASESESESKNSSSSLSSSDTEVEQKKKKKSRKIVESDDDAKSNVYSESEQENVEAERVEEEEPSTSGEKKKKKKKNKKKITEDVLFI